MTNILAERAVLADVTVRAWSGVALDRKVTDETNRAHNADSDAGRYNKQLVAKTALAPIISAGSAARQAHYTMTLPWSDGGARLLPATMIDRYGSQMMLKREAWAAAVADFVADYPAHIEAARIRLNGMFRETDYPSADNIAARFSYAARLLPVPDADDIRVTVSEAQADMIRADTEAAIREAIATAQADVVERLRDTVGHMAHKLRAFRPGGAGERATGVFRDSLVDNVREIAGMLPSFNLTGSVEIDRIAERIAANLTEHDADALRGDAVLRDRVAREAESIMADVSAII